MVRTAIAQAQQVPILAHPDDIVIHKLDQLNSPFRETNLSISPNGRYLYFMSGRGGQAWSQSYGSLFGGQREFDGDIWYSEYVEGEWQAPKALGPRINSPQGEDEPNISPDGQRVRFQSWKRNWAREGGPYYESRISDTTWGNPKGLGGGITQFFSRKYSATDGMSISPNDAYFIVAAGRDYTGNLDLFLSKRQTDGQWTFPRPLSLNTRKDERSIFIAGDSKTLYFASNGYGGLGGLDVFKGVLQADGTVGEIVNLGAPFNTKADDYGFIITADGQQAYFVRDGDIYFADLKRADSGIRPGRSLLLGGRVQTEKGKSLEAEIQLIDPTSGEVLATTQSNARSGEYALAMAWRSGPYVLRAQPKDYYEINEAISREQSNTDAEIIRNFVFSESLKVRTRGEARPASPPRPDLRASPPSPEALADFVLLFDYDRAKVLPEYAKLLHDLAETQRKYPDLRIALSGHTDSDGTDGYNLELSRRRVMAVARCLQLEGAERERLWWDFCGESKPVADNDEVFGRADNRRVEIRLMRVPNSEE